MHKFSQETKEMVIVFSILAIVSIGYTFYHTVILEDFTTVYSEE